MFSGSVEFAKMSSADKQDTTQPNNESPPASQQPTQIKVSEKERSDDRNETSSSREDTNLSSKVVSERNPPGPGQCQQYISRSKNPGPCPKNGYYPFQGKNYCLNHYRTQTNLALKIERTMTSKPPPKEREKQPEEAPKRKRDPEPELEPSKQPAPAERPPSPKKEVAPAPKKAKVDKTEDDEQEQAEALKDVMSAYKKVYKQRFKRRYKKKMEKVKKKKPKRATTEDALAPWSYKNSRKMFNRSMGFGGKVSPMFTLQKE